MTKGPGDLPGILAVLGTEDSFLSRTMQIILLAVAAALLTVVVIRMVARRLRNRSVRELNRGMRALAEEDFSFRFDVPASHEFATLGASFNEMAEKLQSTLSDLREARYHFEGIVENSADIIITVSPRGYVYTFNRGAELALGYDRSEVIGRSADMLFADPEERLEAVQRLRGAEDVLNYETQLMAKDGEVRDVILTLSRLRGPDGRTLGAFGIGKDVTEKKRLQKKLLGSERFAAVGQALAGLQHGLKNMLNALKGGSYMVNLGLKKDDRGLLEEGWAMVQEGIENITGMSLHMLNYVKEWKVEFGDVDVGAMVRKIEGVFRSTAEDQGVGLVVDVPEELTIVSCDVRFVHSALMDLLSNALDACLEKEYPDGETPEIGIRAHPAEEGGRFVLAVRDNGCGMPEQLQAHVFAPFFSTKKKLGTGLGLALTARTIRLHGGEIAVTSEEGAGSEFCIMVPIGGPNLGNG